MEIKYSLFKNIRFSFQDNSFLYNKFNKMIPIKRDMEKNDGIRKYQKYCQNIR